MFCDKCGAQLADTAKFCNKCGNTIKKVQNSIKAPVQEVYTDSTTSGKKKQPVRMNKKIMSIVAIVAIIAIVAMVIIPIIDPTIKIESQNMSFVCNRLEGTAVLKDIDASAFEGGNVVVPSEVRKGFRKYKVTGISIYACNELTSVTIPDSVTKIGLRAFQECKSLTNVTIPNSVTEIGMGAFTGCESLTNITIPNSVIEIEASAFSYCESLTNITIPDSVTVIGRYAFQNCRSLVSVTILGKDVKVDVDAFEGCSSQLCITYGE